MNNKENEPVDIDDKTLKLKLNNDYNVFYIVTRDDIITVEKDNSFIKALSITKIKSNDRMAFTLLQELTDTKDLF